MAEREVENVYLGLGGGDDRVDGVWGVGNQLFVFPGGQAAAAAHKLGKPGSQGLSWANIAEIRWNPELDSPITRKLVNQCHNIFVTLQGQVASSTGTSLHSQLVRESKNYRAVLKACSMELMQLADATIDEAQKQSYETQLQMYEMIQLIWSLCEMLFIDMRPDGQVMGQLIDWIRWHFTEGKHLAAKVLQSDQPASHPSYWTAVYKLLLQGEAEQVRKLLSLHEFCQSQAFISADELLRKMPQCAHRPGHSAAELDMKWRHWREECQRRLEEQQFSAFSELETLVQILTGDDATLREMREHCETWYHYMVSRLFFQNPTVRATNLQYRIQGCIEEFGGRVGELDNILQAAMEFEMHQVIKDSSTFLSTGSWWFVAHLTDILHHCGQMDRQKLPCGSSLREFLLLEYASSLMSHKSLWQVGIDYFDFCPEFGRKYLELYIERIPMQTEKKALKILHVLEERELHEQAQSICKQMGVRCLRRGRLGGALSWYLRAKDVASATQVTERILNEYSESGHFSYLDVIDNLGSAMLLSTTLTFLGKYREFHKLYEDGDFHAAGALLLSLLTARLAPRNFWITLLLDAVPLLEAKEVVFDSSQTYELKHCLEEFTMGLPTDKETIRPKALTELQSEKLEMLRVALTRNQARGIINEGTVLLGPARG